MSRCFESLILGQAEHCHTWYASESVSLYQNLVRLFIDTSIGCICAHARCHIKTQPQNPNLPVPWPCTLATSWLSLILNLVFSERNVGRDT
jgi:hypothetical protein